MIDTEGFNDCSYTKVMIADNMQIDAFGRLRVSEINQLVDIKQTHDKLPLLINEVLIGGGISTYNLSESSVTMSVSNNLDAVIRQTKQRYNYQTGKSQFIKITSYDLQPQENVIKRIGYFNSGDISPYDTNLDGLFFESSNGTVYLCIYRNGTQISKVAQSDWTVDKLDGSGIDNPRQNRSRVDIDWTKDQIFFFDFQWLGVGRVRWGFVHDGDSIICHESLHANNIQKVYMSSPNHSLRWEIRSTGGSGSLTHICASVETEGAINENGFPFELYGGSLTAASAGVDYVALAYRLKSTNLDAVIKYISSSVLGTSNDDYRARLVLNPTIAGTPLVYNSIANTSIEFAIGSATNIASGGFSLGGQMFRQSTSQDSVFDSALRIGSDINGTRDIIALVITPLSAGLNYYPIINLKEII